MALAVAVALALAGCAVGPRYTSAPALDTPVAFKQGQGAWVPAVAADALAQGPWWRLFDDPTLNDLVSRVEVSNQNVAAAAAAYAQARAAVAEQRASLFPVVSLQGGADRSRNASGSSSAAGGGARQSYDLSIGASWEPDVWGRLTRGAASARAAEQASAADLAAARLSAQGELAVNYLNLRGIDAERRLLAQTLAGYQRALQITTNRYNAGIVARTDVLQAQTQLAISQADLLQLDRQRAQLENAIAVLVGQAPASFAVPAQEVVSWTAPEAPFTVPSTLLLRRPDIVSAERQVAQANEQIGIAQAARYPSLQLSGAAGAGAASAGELFSAGALVWALGVSLAQTIFDAGATSARVERARAGLELAAARYRQTVLQAFQNVEDQLAASRILREQLALRQLASRAADQVEQQVLNRYLAGQVGFGEVITAQATAQSTRLSLVRLQYGRQVAAVSLIQSLGGGWQAPR